MRVVLFSRFPGDPDRPRGGVESVTVVLARALGGLADLEVHVVTLERERTANAIELVGPVTVHRLPGSRWPQLADVLGGPGKRRLVRYLLDLNPDVVHTHETYGLTLFELPVPHVFTVHGFDHANLVADAARCAWIRSPLWRRLERYGMSRQRHVISISPYVRRMLEPLTTATIYDIDNPVDERFFRVGARPAAGRVLCVGWICHRKNTLAAVQALGHAVARGADAVLAIAGQPKEDEYYREVLRCIERNGLRQRVELLGHISHERLTEELARASVFLLPSRQENAPMAIAEAMAVGVPVIAADRCGMPFMVREGESGYLIDPEDSVQIADRLVRILGDRARAQALRRCARQIAEARFHPAAVARRTREVYRRVCQQAVTAAPLRPATNGEVR